MDITRMGTTTRTALITGRIGVTPTTDRTIGTAGIATTAIIVIITIVIGTKLTMA
jgi:hypothetical protein